MASTTEKEPGNRGYREKYADLHRRLLRKAAKMVPSHRRRGDFVVLGDLVEAYAALPLKEPHAHLTHRSVYTYVKEMEGEGLVETAVVSFGRHERDTPKGRGLMVRFLSPDKAATDKAGED